MIKRLVEPATAQAKADDDIVLDAVLAELERANPAWRVALGKDVKDALTRRQTRRPIR